MKNIEKLQKLFEEVETEEEDELKEIFPCYEVRVDKDRGKLIFIVDGKEILSTALSKFSKEELNSDLFSKFIFCLKTNNIASLKSYAKLK